MTVYRLINPSDPYTFEAPNIEIAGFVAYFLSRAFGAESADGKETTPILFGWDEWLEDRGIDHEWGIRHAKDLADAFDSFLIGGVNERQDVLDMLAVIPDEKKEEWRVKRQERHRSSMNEIGEAAYKYAKEFRKLASESGVSK